MRRLLGKKGNGIHRTLTREISHVLTLRRLPTANIHFLFGQLVGGKLIYTIFSASPSYIFQPHALSRSLANFQCQQDGMPEKEKVKTVLECWYLCLETDTFRDS